MRRIIPILALLVLASGCATHARRSRTAPPPDREMKFANAQAYDRFVVKRTDALYAGGNFKNRQDAGRQAEKDALERFGARTRGADSGDSYSAPLWGREVSPRGLTLAELDDALAAMKQSRDR